MEYISADEFLKQPKNVQNVLRNFCKESFCLYQFNDEIRYGLFIKRFTPLFTEGQLREFIEEKEHCKIDIIVIADIGDYFEYGLDLYTYDKGYGFGYGELDDPTEYEIKAKSLLEAYWKVACRIIGEE